MAGRRSVVGCSREFTAARLGLRSVAPRVARGSPRARIEPIGRDHPFLPAIRTLARNASSEDCGRGEPDPAPARRTTHHGSIEPAVLSASRRRPRNDERVRGLVDRSPDRPTEPERVLLLFAIGPAGLLYLLRQPPDLLRRRWQRRARLLRPRPRARADGPEPRSRGAAGAVATPAAAAPGGAAGDEAAPAPGGTAGDEATPAPAPGGAAGDEATPAPGGTAGDAAAAAPRGAARDSAATTSGGAAGDSAATTPGGAAGDSAATTSGGTAGDGAATRGAAAIEAATATAGRPEGWAVPPSQVAWPDSRAPIGIAGRRSAGSGLRSRGLFWYFCGL
jgi:hypothetical protein